MAGRAGSGEGIAELPVQTAPLEGNRTRPMLLSSAPPDYTSDQILFKVAKRQLARFSPRQFLLDTLSTLVRLGRLEHSIKQRCLVLCRVTG